MDDTTFGRALSGFADRLEKVDDLGAPTPCADWDVRALVNHVVNELRWVPPLLDGKTIAEVGDALEGDLLGDDAVAAYAAARAEAEAAVARPGVRERTVHLSFGDFPGGEYLGQVGSDVVIHAWDLAVATGQDGSLDPGLAEEVYAFLAPQADAWRAAGAFGPAVETGEGASIQDRLLGLTGRDPARS